MNKYIKSDSESFISNFFSKENLRFNIRNLSYLPRWIVLAIDLAVLIASFFFTKLIINGIGLHFISFENKLKFICLLVGVNLFFFWIFRTYAGIIRYSSYTDAIKLLFSQVSVFFIFVSGNAVYEFFYATKIYLNTALFIYMILSFCGLFLVS